MTEEAKTPMPPLFIEFLKSYLEWIMRGAPDNDPYTRDMGLCFNYAYRFPYDVDASSSIYYWMPEQFPDSDSPFPFYPEPDPENYTLNTKRIDWIINFLKDNDHAE